MSILLLSFLSPVHAAEVVWDGHYRARGLVYDSLSLSRTNPNALERTAYVDHRFRLQPGIQVNSKLQVNAQLDFMPLTPYGNATNVYYDPVTGDTLPVLMADGVTATNDPEDGSSYLSNMSLTRAWADAYTPIGRLSFGRMPTHWGMGIWLNDGLQPDDEFGDSADRVQFTTLAGPVYVMGAWQVESEGWMDQADDVQSADLAVAYLSETLGLGFYNRYRFQPSADYQGWTGDVWGYAELGPAKLQLEVVGTVGRGDLSEDANDVQMSALGGALDLSADLDRFTGAFQFGVATGDVEPDDANLHTYTFDRDHDVALLMFEEPLPTLQAAVINDANGGRDSSVVLTGEGVRNAIYLRPTFGYKAREDLLLTGTLVGARAFKLPEEQADDRGYGWEIDATAHYTPIPGLEVRGTAGVMLPGSYYASFEDADLGGGFSDPVYGGRLFLIASF